MLILFPDPYEDELMYGVLARYQHLTARTSSQVLNDLFGSSKFATVDYYLPNTLNTILFMVPGKSEHTVWDWVTKHTLFPYFANFLSYPNKRQLMLSITTNNCAAPHVSQSLVFRRKLKCCPQCIGEDIETVGEPYWHRNHQPATVNFCIKHKRYLMDECPSCRAAFSQKDSTLMMCKRYCGSCSYDLTLMTGALSHFRKREQEILMSLTNQTVEMMEKLHNPLNWEDNWSEICKQYAGFSGISILDVNYRKRYLDSLISFYGERLWNFVNRNTRVPNYWLYEMYYLEKPADPLLFHLQLFYLNEIHKDNGLEVAVTFSGKDKK